MPLVQDAIDSMNFPAGYTWTFGSWQSSQEKRSREFMINLALALMLVFVVMSSLFESLRQAVALMIALPFALAGAFWTLYLVGADFDQASSVGTLLLIGIVVNNGIVMIEHINAYRRRGMPREEAMLLGGRERLRPILTLLSARACGGKEEDALPPAAAVEILHNFTLVHDDIMDRDDTRHGQPALHVKWDQSVAILAGDAMFALALAELHRSPRNLEALYTAFQQGVLAVCEGQALDKEFESRTEVTLDEYLHMVDLKTGYLLGLAAELGAIIASASQDQVTGVRRYGRLLGRAFQVQDDLLEIFSDAGTMGKSLGSDILAEKKTYLLILAQARAPDQVRQAVAVIGSDLEGGLAAVREVIIAQGLREEAEDTVHRTIQQALEELGPLGEDDQLLLEFARLILERKN